MAKAKIFNKAIHLYGFKNLSMQWFSIVICASIAIFLITMQELKPEQSKNIKQTLLQTLTPIAGFISAPVQSIGDAIKTTQNLLDLKNKNNQLQAQINSLQFANAELSHLRQENQNLRVLLNLNEDNRTSYITARIISDTSGQFYRTILVNSGSNNGVKEDMPVISQKGLIGRIIEVGNNYSRILLITDWSSRIPITIENTNVNGIIAGANSKQPQVIHLKGEEISSLAKGNRILTSGKGGIFPPGIPIGELRIKKNNKKNDNNINNAKLNIAPYSDTDKLTFVNIIVSQQAQLKGDQLP